jgi:hypothetical protein
MVNKAGIRQHRQQRLQAARIVRQFQSRLKQMTCKLRFA